MMKAVPLHLPLPSAMGPKIQTLGWQQQISMENAQKHTQEHLQQHQNAQKHTQEHLQQ